MLTRRKSKRSGFALIEVLVAVVVLAVGITFVLRSFSTSIRALKISRDYMMASALLDETLRAVEDGRLTTDMPADSAIVIEGTHYALHFESGGGSVASRVGLKEVYVSVRWDDGRRQFGVTTLVEP